MDVARNSAKRKIEEDAAEDKQHQSKEKKEPKRRRIEIPAGPAAPAAPSSTQPTTASSPPKPKVYKRRNASPSTLSIAATRPISSPPRVQDTQRKRALATTATTSSKHDSPSPSRSSPQPSTPPINRPPIKFATPQRNLTLKQRASDSTGSPTATATATADSTTPKPTTPERPSATRFRVADRFVATSSSPRSTTSGSLAPPNLGELTRMLRSAQSSSSSTTTTSPSSQLLSSSPFKQLRLTSSPSPSSSSYSPSSSSPSSLLPSSSSSSFASTHQRSPEKQLSSTVAQEMRRFRRTQETRVRNFQAEVRQGLSPFRGRKLFPEPEIDDDAILPPIVKPEPRDEEDINGIDNNNHNHNEEQDHRPLHDAEAAGLMDVAATTTTGQEEPHSGGCAHNSSDAIVLD